MIKSQKVAKVNILTQSSYHNKKSAIKGKGAQID